MLYERIIGRDDSGRVVENRIVPETFAACLSEYARGILTSPQALAVMDSLGMPLDAGEQTEAQTLLATVTGTSAQKLARNAEIRDVLFLARLQALGYSRPSEVKTRLGV